MGMASTKASKFGLPVSFHAVSLEFTGCYMFLLAIDLVSLLIQVTYSVEDESDGFLQSYYIFCVILHLLCHITSFVLH